MQQRKFHKDLGPDYIPPRDVTHPDIRERRQKSFVVALLNGGHFWWKTGPSIAALAGQRASSVQCIPPDEIGGHKEDDFPGRFGVNYNKAIAENRQVCHFRVWVDVDWRRVFNRDDYGSFNRKLDWKAMVESIEAAHAMVVKDKIGMPRSGPNMGLIDFNTFVQTAEQIEGSGNFYLYLERPRGGNVPKTQWRPCQNKILYDAP